MKRNIAFCTLSVGLIGGVPSAVAQQFPERPIRVIVPFAPGGNVDLSARAITPGMADQLGKSVVVDNRGGAGGTLGAELVASAPPDGYTLLVGSTGVYSIAPSVYPKLRFDPLKDFAPIALISNVPLVMLVHPSMPVRSVKEFVALAKRRGSEMTMGSSGNFSTGQLAGALFQHVTGTKFIHVPYKGASLAAVDLMGGHVDLMFDQASSAMGYIRGGKVRALGVTAAARSADLPDVPTMREAGVPGVEAGTFTAMVAPGGTPAPVVQRLADTVKAVLASKPVRDNFAKQGADILESTPASTARYLQDELRKWTQVIRAAGIKADAQ